jgi:hypothetical protein
MENSLSYRHKLQMAPAVSEKPLRQILDDHVNSTVSAN